MIENIAHEAGQYKTDAFISKSLLEDKNNELDIVNYELGTIKMVSLNRSNIVDRSVNMNNSNIINYKAASKQNNIPTYKSGKISEIDDGMFERDNDIAIETNTNLNTLKSSSYKINEGEMSALAKMKEIENRFE